MLIAGDIGGTKTDLAIFSSEAGAHAPLADECCCKQVGSFSSPRSGCCTQTNMEVGMIGFGRLGASVVRPL
jgi:hypothetical protein